MAINQISVPNAMTPVNNPIFWTATSTNDTEPAFKFLVDIYINSVLVKRFKISPEPTTGNDLLTLDVSKVLRDYISRNLYTDAQTNGIISGESSFLNYEIRFGEEYEVTGTLTQFPDLAIDTGSVFNGALSYVDFVDFDSADYIDTLFLTNAPRAQETDLHGFGSLHLLVDSGTTLTNLEIETFLGGVSQTVYNVTTALSATEYYIFASGVGSINNIDPSKFTVPPVQPIITNSIDQYKVTVNLSSGATETFTYNIVERCSERTPIRLHWFNRLGGYDYFDFNQTARDSYNVNRESMKQSLSPITITGIVNYSKRDRINRDYCVTDVAEAP